MACAQQVRDLFAEIFAELDARPRERAMRALAAFGVSIDCGEPVFSCSGTRAGARLRGRWIAEHPVPLEVKPGEIVRFEPAGGNRVKVRAGGALSRFRGFLYRLAHRRRES